VMLGERRRSQREFVSDPIAASGANDRTTAVCSGLESMTTAGENPSWGKSGSQEQKLRPITRHGSRSEVVGVGIVPEVKPRRVRRALLKGS
jgi:hypothetical protein